MPTERKHRGRRAEQKRKREEQEIEGNSSAPSADPLNWTYGEEHHVENETAIDTQTQGLFLGLLDEQEQEYFKSLDSLIETNLFATDEEKSIFLTNVHKELDGKELKVASSG